VQIGNVRQTGNKGIVGMWWRMKRTGIMEGVQHRKERLRVDKCLKKAEMVLR
jgi:hypothetical protein